MAGLFGGQNAPGPGVSKNEPQKTQFFKFFELYFRKFWKLMVANVLYVLVSLPIVTRGLAEAGMAYVTRNYSREKHVFLPSDFFDTIKKNWKQSLLFGILELVVGAVMGFSLYYYYLFSMLSTENFSIMAVLPLAIALFIVMMYVFMRYYIYIQIITFKMSFKQIVKNSALFAAGGIKQNFLITVILLALYAITFVMLWFFHWFSLGIIIPLYLLVFPAFRSFLIHFTVFPLVKKSIIDPYYREHPNEDIEKRRDLNLETDNVTESQAEEEEPIFTDVTAPPAPKEPLVAPKQYGADELHRGKRLVRRDTNDADDDGTI